MIGVMSRNKMDYKYAIEGRENGGAFHSLKVQSKKAYDAPHEDGFGIYVMSFKDSRQNNEGREPEHEFLFKNGARITENAELSKRLNYANGNLLISHIRKASAGKGEIDGIHAHPYAYVSPDFFKIKGININNITDWENSTNPYSSYVFAHNGTIYNLGDESMTDSQALLDLIAGNFKNGVDFEGLKEFISDFTGRFDFTAINFLLKDSKNDLYALRLAKAKRKGDDPQKQPRLAYYSLYYLKDDDKVVIASEPFDSDRGWKCINNYTLLKIDKDLNITMAEID